MQEFLHKLLPALTRPNMSPDSARADGSSVCDDDGFGVAITEVQTYSKCPYCSVTQDERRETHEYWLWDLTPLASRTVDLQTYIDGEFLKPQTSDPDSKCYTCGKLQVALTRRVELSYAGRWLLLNMNLLNRKVKLPDVLTVRGRQYTLCGIGQRVSADSTPHFIARVKTKGNVWKHIDDLRFNCKNKGIRVDEKPRIIGSGCVAAYERAQDPVVRRRGRGGAAAAGRK